MNCTRTFYITPRGERLIDADPQSELRYVWNLTRYLQRVGGTVASYEFVLEDGLVNVEQGATGPQPWCLIGVDAPVGSMLRATLRFRFTVAGVTAEQSDDLSFFINVVET